jgi:hypothetical protein
MVIHRIDKTIIIDDDVGVLSAVKIHTYDVWIIDKSHIVLPKK